MFQIISLILCFVAVIANASERTSSVKIIVINSYGRSLDVKVSSFQSPKGNFADKFSVDLIADNIPYGTYQLILHYKKLEKPLIDLRQIVKLNNKNKIVVITELNDLLIGKDGVGIKDSYIDPPGPYGRIINHTNSTRDYSKLWVRLLPLFFDPPSDRDNDTGVDAEGKFFFQEPRIGSHLILVMSGTDILWSKQVVLEHNNLRKEISIDLRTQ